MVILEIILWHLFALSISTHAQVVFTSLVGLEKLLHAQKGIIKSLEAYLMAEEARLNKIRWYYNKYSELNVRAKADGASFFSNPLNGYLMIKRLSADWRAVRDAAADQKNKEILELANYDEENGRHVWFPNERDLKGSAASIERLQRTYKLNMSEIIHGRLKGKAETVNFTAGDCFEIGKVSYEDERYDSAIGWLSETLKQIDVENPESIDRDQVMEKLIYSTAMVVNVTLAVGLLEKHLSGRPTSRTGDLKCFLEALYSVQSCEQENAPDADVLDFPEQDHRSWLLERYERLCREGNLRPAAHEVNLTCSYATNNNPYLLLQPAKEEVLNLDPRIVLYHNVLSDKEMDIVKGLAREKLSIALVTNALGKTEIFNISHRVSKVSWLEDGLHPIISRFSQRMTDITGLDASTAENLQVANYGIGGFFEPHYDLSYTTSVEEHFKKGARIATWLTYMSDVELGGATVFPYLGLSIEPKRGSAAFWYNMWRNGSAHPAVYHGACPVLAGGKWASNKWFRTVGQEFRVPCSVNRNE